MALSYNNILILGLIIVSSILLVIFLFTSSRRQKSKTSSESLTGAMSILDIHRLKERGVLTDEEAKALRSAVARRTQERLDRMSSQPPAGQSAEEMLAAALAEAETRRQNAAATADQE